MKRLALVACATLLLPANGRAQANDVVDRLVAIVGDSVVIQSQIEEQIQRMGLEGGTVPQRDDPAYGELFTFVLDELVNRLLVLQAAAKDSLIRVDDATIDERVQGRLDELARQMGGQPALQQALAAEGLTLAAYREMMRNEARMEQLQAMFYQLRLRDAAPVDITETEMLERFQSARESLEQRPKLVTFRQLVVRPQASDSAWEVARVEADGLLVRVRAGEDFAELATAHSDDPGSGALGGDLGWFRRGRMVREFEDAAFALVDGEVSPLVRTDFGYHIIKVDRSRAGERQARHILIIPERTETDAVRARTLVQSALARARAGESIAALRAELGEVADPLAPDSLTVTFEQIAELPPAYVALRTATSGTFLGPLEFDAGGNDVRLAAVEVVAVREAGAWTFEELRGQIATQLQQEKQRASLLEGLRASTYIEVRR